MLRDAIIAAIQRLGTVAAPVLLAELQRIDARITFEAMYEGLVSLEADASLRIEALCSRGQRVGSVWAIRAEAIDPVRIEWGRAAPLPTAYRSVVHLCR